MLLCSFSLVITLHRRHHKGLKSLMKAEYHSFQSQVLSRWMVLPDGGALARRFGKLSTAKEVCFADMSKSTSLCPTSEVWRTRMLDWIGIEEKAIDRMGFWIVTGQATVSSTCEVYSCFILTDRIRRVRGAYRFAIQRTFGAKLRSVCTDPSFIHDDHFTCRSSTWSDARQWEGYQVTSGAVARRNDKRIRAEEEKDEKQRHLFLCFQICGCDWRSHEEDWIATVFGFVGRLAQFCA